MSKAFYALRKIDLFGKPLIFEDKESQRHHTAVGNIVTVLIIATCLVFIFLFGNEIYERKTPAVIVSEEIIESKLNFRDYPVMFTFQYFNGLPIRNTSKAFNLTITNITVTSELNVIYQEIKGWMKECDLSQYEEKYRLLINKTLEDNRKANTGAAEMFCVDPNLFVQSNPFNSTALNFRFAPCNPKERECHPDLARVSQDAYVFVRTFDGITDPKNYTNPITYLTTIRGQQISGSFMKRTTFSIQKSKLVTHKGWLLEDIVEEEFFTMGTESKDINPTFRNEIFIATFSASTRRSLLTRKYMKVQDLLANIGGFFNFLHIFSFILLNDYVNFNFYASYLKYLTGDKFNNNSNVYLKGSKTIEMLVKNELKSNKNLKERFYDLNAKNISTINNRVNESNAINLINKIPPLNINNNAISELKQNNYVASSNKSLNNKESINSSSPTPNLNHKNIDKKHIKRNLGNDYDKKDIDNFDNKNNLVLKANSELNNGEFNKIQNQKINSYNYFSYFWSDNICCRNKLTNYIQAVREILSFKTVIELSTEYYYSKLSEN